MLQAQVPLSFTGFLIIGGLSLPITAALFDWAGKSAMYTVYQKTDPF